MKASLTIACFSLFCFLRNSDAETAPVDAVMPERHFTLFDKYCLECHDSLTEKGKVNLETLDFQISKDILTAELWQKVLDSINSGEMPPEDKEQISSEEKADFLAILSKQMVNARNILGDTGGEITMRRLNRREYQNTLHDLLGFEPVVDALPDDSATGGFDTSGASLYMSSDQLELYRETAKAALTFALIEKPEPKKQHFEPEASQKDFRIPLYGKIEQVKERRAEILKQPERTERDESSLNTIQWRIDVANFYWLERPETERGVVLNPGGINFGLYVKIMPKPLFEGGTYRLKIRAGSYHDRPLRERYLQVSVRQGDNTREDLTQYARVDGTVDQPETIEMELTVPPGRKTTFPIKQRTYFDGSQQSYLYNQWKEKNGLGIPAGVWVESYEVEGPFFSERINWLPNLVQSCKNKSEEVYARQLFSRFAKEAFREKLPDPDYLANMVKYYLNQREVGANKEEATLECLALILSSPSFLYLIEPRGEDTSPTKLNDRELAIRLAYFLTSSPPDEKLMSLARQKKLSDPDVLRSETDRLLESSKADQMISGFAHQWLDMKRIDMFEFKAKYHPRFDQAVRFSARREIYSTLRHLLDNDLPIDLLLNSDFVVVNDVLSDFYQLPAADTSPVYQPVKLDAESPRGGLLGMAATHIMGSDGKRSSPIERGAWVLRHILNDPPPPAPPNVPMIAHDDKVEPIRQILGIHMKEAQCAQCHRRIDPIGYGMEHFAASGLWRDKEPVEVGVASDKLAVPDFKYFDIDPSGELPNGESFVGFHEMREMIANQYTDAFARGFTEHLIAYGLGRPYGFSDHNLATRIVKQAKEKGSTPSAFIHALIQSKPFQTK